MVVLLPPAWMEGRAFVAGPGNSSRAMVLCAVATTGLFAGVVVPVALELLAEVSHPTRCVLYSLLASAFSVFYLLAIHPSIDLC